MPIDTPKKKRKSGWDHVKDRRAKEAAAKEALLKASPAPPQPNNTWGAGWNYATASQVQWDPNGPPIELPIYGQPPANLVTIIASIIAQLEQGAFYQSAYLWDGMTRDDRVAATVGQRIDRLVASPMILKPSDPDEEDDADELGPSQIAAEEAKKLIDKMLPVPQIYELSRYALGLGVGIAQVLTTATVKSWTPTFRVWNPRYLRFDWTLRQFMLITQNRGEIVLEEEDPEWIIYQPFGNYGWLHGALMRALVQPWLVRYWTRTWWARYQEVHGQPIRLGIIPTERKPADEQQFLKQLANLAHEAVVRIPQGKDGNQFDVKLLESMSTNWQGFQKLLDHCDDSIAIAVLGQRQSTMGQGGLQAQDNAGESTLVRITRKDALIATPLRDKILKPWAEDNLGDEELAPLIEWQFEAPEDESKSADVDLKVSQALNYFKTADAPIDIREFLTARGYPLLSVEEVAALKIERAEQAQASMEAMQQPGDSQPPSQKGAPPKGPDADESQSEDASQESETSDD